METVVSATFGRRLSLVHVLRIGLRCGNQRKTCLLSLHDFERMLLTPRPVKVIHFPYWLSGGGFTPYYRSCPLPPPLPLADPVARFRARGTERRIAVQFGRGSEHRGAIGENCAGTR
jgi:hypothetical protein